MHIHYQGRIQVLWGPEAYTISGALCKKRNTKSDYKIRHESEYLFGAPPRALEGACAGPEAHSKSTPVCYIGVLVPTLN